VIETIENSHWRLSLAADLGASPTALQAQIGGQWQDIFRPTASELLNGTSSAKFSSYTLAPWSNRIPNGIFEFQGQTHQLLVNIPKEQTARHGDVQDRAWKVINHGSSLECSFDSSWYADINFPFPFTMTITHTLKNNVYITAMTLTNTGSSSMPAGMGIHPYFVRRATMPALCFIAKNIYLTDSSNVPTKAAEPIPERFDFSTQKPLSDFGVDHVYQGWDGVLKMVWEDMTLHLEGTDIFDHLVVFTAAPDQTIALEPITHATNAFNLAAKGIQNTGHRVLEPGETLTGEVRIWIEPNLDS
jgi:aldose 1-epimerase